MASLSVRPFRVPPLPYNGYYFLRWKAAATLFSLLSPLSVIKRQFCVDCFYAHPGFAENDTGFFSVLA